MWSYCECSINDANTQILKVRNKRESMLKISIQKGKELFLKCVKTTLYVREWETILQIQQKHDLEAYDNTFIFFTLDIYILPNAHDDIYSCLENPMDKGAWWAAVHGVAKSRTWLSDFPLWLIHVEVWQKAKFYKAIILQ